MKIDIVEKKDAPLLARQNIRGVVVFDKATPSNDELAAVLAKQLNVGFERIMIKRIGTFFGASKANFLACIYNSKKDLDYFEPKPRKWLEKMKKKEEVAKAKAGESAEKSAPAQGDSAAVEASK